MLIPINIQQFSELNSLFWKLVSTLVILSAVRIRSSVSIPFLPSQTLLFTKVCIRGYKLYNIHIGNNNYTQSKHNHTQISFVVVRVFDITHSCMMILLDVTECVNHLVEDIQIMPLIYELGVVSFETYTNLYVVRMFSWSYFIHHMMNSTYWNEYVADKLLDYKDVWQV